MESLKAITVFTVVLSINYPIISKNNQRFFLQTAQANSNNEIIGLNLQNSFASIYLQLLCVNEQLPFGVNDRVCTNLRCRLKHFKIERIKAKNSIMADIIVAHEKNAGLETLVLFIIEGVDVLISIKIDSPLNGLPGQSLKISVRFEAKLKKN